METKKKISLAVLGAVCCLQLGGVAMAEEAKPTASLAVSALSKYVWRGFELSKDSVVIQPSLTVAYQGFSANAWGNVDTDFYLQDSSSNMWNETDFTLAYDWAWEPVGLTLGYIYYGLDGLEDTQEVFARAAIHTLLTPTLSVYRDYDHLPSWYVTLGVSHSVPVTEKVSLNLGAQVGYLDAEDASSYPEFDGVGNATADAYSGFHDGLLTASLAIPVAEYFTITPVVSYSFPLSDEASDLIETASFDYIMNGNGGDSDFVYGGVTLSMAF